MVALLNYREDGVTRKSRPRSEGFVFSILTRFAFSAYLSFWKHGLKQVKL